MGFDAFARALELIAGIKTYGGEMAQAKKVGGRPRWEPTQDQRWQARFAIATGYTQEDVAQSLGISICTLQRHLRRELKDGAMEVNTKVAQALYRIAIGETRAPAATRLTAQMFWLRCRANWKEPQTAAAFVIPAGVSFADWLAGLSDAEADRLYATDRIREERRGPAPILAFSRDPEEPPTKH